VNAHQDRSKVPLIGMSDPTPAGEPDTVQYLLELVGEEPRVLTDLQGCVDRLARVQEARQCLARVPVATLRAAMATRSNALQGSQQ